MNQITKTDFPQILTTGRDAQILKAKFQTKISEYESEKDLIETLSFIFALIGIRGNNLPDELQTKVLISFIRKKFGNLTIAQIRQAFTMYAAAELENAPDHFQTFSGLFFSKVVQCYQTEVLRATKANERALAALELETNQPTEEEREKFDREFFEEIVLPFLEKKTEFDLGIIPGAVIYDFIFKRIGNEVFCFNDRDKFQSIEKARKQIQNEAESEKDYFERIRLFEQMNETEKQISIGKKIILLDAQPWQIETIISELKKIFE
jgi:hypothetical protein